MDTRGQSDIAINSRRDREKARVRETESESKREMKKIIRQTE